MKIILSVIIVFTLLTSCSQNAVDTSKGDISAIDTNCNKGKPHYMASSLDWAVEVDTIDEQLFKMLVDTVYADMQNGNLSQTEDRGIIKIINTSEWAYEDSSQTAKIKKFPKVKLIEDLYEKVYRKAFYCKYRAGFGGGCSLCYDELKICIGGKPSVCARFYIEELGDSSGRRRISEPNVRSVLHVH